jgi:hypothetical protein
MKMKKLQNGLKSILWQYNIQHIERAVLYKSNEWNTGNLKKKPHPQDETHFVFLDDNGEAETDQPRGLTS